MFLNKKLVDEDQRKDQNNDMNRNDQDQNYPNMNQGLVQSRIQAIENRTIYKEPAETIEVDEQDDNILQFQDLDEEDDDEDDIQSQSYNMNNRLVESSNYISTQSPIHEQRQKIIEQQKQNLSKPNFTSQNVQANQDFIKNLGQNSSNYHQQDEIDYDMLQQNNNAYEPGQFQYNIGAQLPQLTKFENKHPEQSVDDYQHHQTNKDQSQHVGIFMKQRTPVEEEQKQMQTQDQGKQEQLEILSLTDSDRDEQDQKSEFIQILDDQSQTNLSQFEQFEHKVLELETPSQDLESKAADEQLQRSLNPLTQQKKLPYPKALNVPHIPNMKQFLTNPCPKGGMIQCSIKRDKSGMGRFYPKYHLHLSTGYQFLMIAKKRSLNNTSNYIVSMNKNDPEKKSGGEFLGKVRSNFLGTEFVLYDSGDKPSKAKFLDNHRKELGVVLYESNLLGAKGPRKMKIILPKCDDSNTQFVGHAKNHKQSLLQDYKSGQTDGMTTYVNRHPKWNEVVQAFVLNFYGRVDKPSVKNFQLIEEDNEDNIYLQFGRTGEEMFNLDFQWPLSPLQAFQIAISSFDYKIACE